MIRKPKPVNATARIIYRDDSNNMIVSVDDPSVADARPSQLLLVRRIEGVTRTSRIIAAVACDVSLECKHAFNILVAARLRVATTSDKAEIARAPY